MSLWSRAAEVAAKTPPSRNRLVDFLRAASILAVISGHWLLTAPYLSGGDVVLGNMLELADFTRWLSWGFQVMPVFFLVGGYANAASWGAALRDGKPFATWLDSRLRRLLLPVLPLIALWVVLAPVGRLLGLDPSLVEAASRIALVPIWFLAIYSVIILFVPLTYRWWKRFGFWSFVVPAGLAALDDALFFAGFEALGWFNYLFIWIAVHQLGYAWMDGRVSSSAVRLVWGGTGLAALIGLTVTGPYPIPMISVPGAEISNTLPPKLPLLALAVGQAGLVLALESPLRRWLQRPTPWTAAVLLNGMIMTIYLWHSTAMVLIIALAGRLGNVGLGVAPATGEWWATRPIWLAIYALTLAAMMPIVARFERLPAPARHASAYRQLTGAFVMCLGLAMLSYAGLGGVTPLPLQVVAALTPFAGALLAGLLVTRTR
jgi:hypothetical protein